MRLNISVRHLHSFKICKCIAKSSYHWCWLINLIVQCCGVFTLMFLNWYMYIVQWWYISYHICDIPQRFLWDTCILNYDQFYYTANLFILHVYKWEVLHLNDFLPTKLYIVYKYNRRHNFRGKPKKTLYTVPITQYSHTYDIVFSSPTFDDTYFFRPMVNICAIEDDTILWNVELIGPTHNLYKCMMMWYLYLLTVIIFIIVRKYSKI